MRSARPVGLLLSAAAALLWAIGMTVLQPLTEPIGPWSERLPGNNAYWARDLRFTAIVAVVLGLVLAGRGRLRWTGPAVLLGGLWLAADVTIDRADPTGAGPTVLLAAVGCAVLGAVAAVPWWRERDATGAGTDRWALTGAACVAGVLTMVATGIESPTDREPELNPAAFATGVLLVALTIGAALAAAPARTRARCVLAAGLGVAAVAGVGLIRTIPPGPRALPELALGAVLLTGVTLLAWDWPGGRPSWRRHAVAALAALVGPTVLLLVVAIVMIVLLPVGAMFTALAGNSPINAADSDVLYSLIGLLAGLGMGLLLAWPPALGYRADPSGPLRPLGSEGPAGPAGGRPASAERR
ncbi:hypothetical protein EAD89_16295 [Micromonospora sp. BL4]|uniref:hypothetical protein n=1 Tax=Micromonospora sp. BL4 TaxID=2478710 RepID=UPI000EF62DCF|nr:hypothetical protein [Micromonospora sp. BL4]RLP88599.1 hypothetical protein EAD89_16295 [Micromonospora sp. BL4]